MVAPKVVVIERLEVFSNGNQRRTRRVQRNRSHLIAADFCLFQNFSRGRGQSLHVIRMRLRGKFGVFAFAMKGIFGNGGSEQPSFAIHQRNAHAQSPKVNACNYSHSASPLKKSTPIHAKNKSYASPRG